MTYNIDGPALLNIGPFFLNQATAEALYLAWGSFDGSTNAPIVYPDFASVTNYYNNLVLECFPLSLPNGQDGVNYTFSYTNSASGVAYANNQLSGTGGTPPYTFSVTPGMSLPPGLAVQTNVVNGVTGYFLTGTPTAVGTFYFSIRMTDAGARSIDTPYTVTINPP